jgi:hypothetical protein
MIITLNEATYLVVNKLPNHRFLMVIIEGLGEDDEDASRLFGE